MIREGTEIEWSWGDGVAKGTVKEVHNETITLKIDGNEVTRHGTNDNPAYVIEQSDGTQVLKLQSEVSRNDS